VRLHPILLTLLLAYGSAAAQTPPVAPVAPSTNNAPPRALPVNPADLANAAAPLAVPNGVNVHWYGHGFVYLTSSVGIRAAIDPFNPQAVGYKFPDHLSADIVLVTHEAEDHCAANQVFGNPLIFRSVMAVGFNRANGIPFYGVPLEKDNSGHGGANTAFTIAFDGVRFGYLGQVNAPLTSQEKQQFGSVDVLFLPVGLQTLTVAELDQIAKDCGARMIIPLNYKTDESGDIPLRTLDDYLSGTKFPARKISSDEIVVTRSSLPERPMLYLLKSP
jgi:L-ascorbate metabolism protein UlaG (beta-lactamase superfamily)